MSMTLGRPDAVSTFDHPPEPASHSRIAVHQGSNDDQLHHSNLFSPTAVTLLANNKADPARYWLTVAAVGELLRFAAHPARTVILLRLHNAQGDWVDHDALVEAIRAANIRFDFGGHIRLLSAVGWIERHRSKTSYYRLQPSVLPLIQTIIALTRESRLLAACSR